MIRILTYIAVSIFGLTVSYAQMKSEEILLINENIEHPSILIIKSQKSPYLKAGFSISQKLTPTIVNFVNQ